jgi:hypothetical protein
MISEEYLASFNNGAAIFVDIRKIRDIYLVEHSENYGWCDITYHDSFCEALLQANKHMEDWTNIYTECNKVCGRPVEMEEPEYMGDAK